MCEELIQSVGLSSFSQIPEPLKWTRTSFLALVAYSRRDSVMSCPPLCRSLLSGIDHLCAHDETFHCSSRLVFHETESSAQRMKRVRMMKNDEKATVKKVIQQECHGVLLCKSVAHAYQSVHLNPLCRQLLSYESGTTSRAPSSHCSRGWSSLEKRDCFVAFSRTCLFFPYQSPM